MADEQSNTQDINQEQIDELKEKIIKQINGNSNFSQEQKDQFIQKIQSLDNEGFIEFLKKQGIIKEEGGETESAEETSEQGEQKCVFCSIVFGDIPSWKIAENEKAIAVLELNPVSKGHSLIIPKEHISDQNQVPEEAKHLAMAVSKRIKSELEPKEVKFEGKQMFGHQILNIIPLYEGQKQEELQQNQASKEELKEIYEKLTISGKETGENVQEKESENTNEKEQIDEKDFWLPKRIP